MTRERLARDAAAAAAARRRSSAWTLSAAERAALANEWAGECRRAGLERLAACFNAALDDDDDDAKDDDEDEDEDNEGPIAGAHDWDG